MESSVSSSIEMENDPQESTRACPQAAQRTEGWEMMNIFRRNRRKHLPEDAQIQEIEERHDIAQQVFFRREAIGLTQETLAASAGMTQAQIAQIEAGHANPTHRTLVKLAAALGCRVRDLYSPLADEATQQKNSTSSSEQMYSTAWKAEPRPL